MAEGKTVRLRAYPVTCGAGKAKIIFRTSTDSKNYSQGHQKRCSPYRSHHPEKKMALELWQQIGTLQLDPWLG